MDLFDADTPNAVADTFLPTSEQDEKLNRRETPSSSPQAGESVQEAVGQPGRLSLPMRKKARILPWFIFMLTLVTAGSFWLQKEKWLDNRWLRSTLINLDIPIPLRDKDWLVIPESVHAEWISRDDDSKAMLIRGRVKNLLSSELPVPVIEIKFFSIEQADKVIGNRRQRITLQPGMQNIKHAPFVAPAPDPAPVAPEGEREFLFVLESTPENIGDFTLAAHVR
jgi:hypothetical protein